MKADTILEFLSGTFEDDEWEIQGVIRPHPPSVPFCQSSVSIVEYDDQNVMIELEEETSFILLGVRPIGAGVADIMRYHVTEVFPDDAMEQLEASIETCGEYTVLGASIQSEASTTTMGGVDGLREAQSESGGSEGLVESRFFLAEIDGFLVRVVGGTFRTDEPDPALAEALLEQAVDTILFAIRR